MGISGIGGGGVNALGSSGWVRRNPADQGVAPDWGAPDKYGDVAVTPKAMIKLATRLWVDETIPGKLIDKVLRQPGYDFGPAQLQAVEKALGHALREIAERVHPTGNFGPGSIAKGHLERGQDLRELTRRNFVEALRAELGASQQTSKLTVRRQQSNMMNPGSFQDQMIDKLATVLLDELFDVRVRGFRP